MEFCPVCQSLLVPKLNPKGLYENYCEKDKTFFERSNPVLYIERSTTQESKIHPERILLDDTYPTIGKFCKKCKEETTHKYNVGDDYKKIYVCIKCQTWYSRGN